VALQKVLGGAWEGPPNCGKGGWENERGSGQINECVTTRVGTTVEDVIKRAAQGTRVATKMHGDELQGGTEARSLRAEGGIGRDCFHRKKKKKRRKERRLKNAVNRVTARELETTGAHASPLWKDRW